MKHPRDIVNSNNTEELNPPPFETSDHCAQTHQAMVEPRDILLVTESMVRYKGELWWYGTGRALYAEASDKSTPNLAAFNAATSANVAGRDGWRLRSSFHASAVVRVRVRVRVRVWVRVRVRVMVRVRIPYA
jgi:hypothetical protein